MLPHIAAIHYAVKSYSRVDFDNLLVPLKLCPFVGNIFLLFIVIPFTSKLSLPVHQSWCFPEFCPCPSSILFVFSRKV